MRADPATNYGLHPANTLMKTEAAVALAPHKETHTRLRNFYTTGSGDCVLGNGSGNIALDSENMCVRGRNVHVRAGLLELLCQAKLPKGCFASRQKGR